MSVFVWLRLQASQWVHSSKRDTVSVFVWLRLQASQWVHSIIEMGLKVQA